MSFDPERLKNARIAMGLSKAETARRLNISAMGYGRYENGQRVPSYQVLQCISGELQISVDYLLGNTSDPSPDLIILSRHSHPELYNLIQKLQTMDEDFIKRISSYASGLLS